MWCFRKRIANVPPLPEDLWLQVLSECDPQTICVAACVDKQFARLRDAAATISCAAQWPQGQQYLPRLSPLGWKQTTALLSKHQAELDALPSLAKRRELQRAVNDKQRAIATEWMIEVAWDWKLEGTVVFEAVTYLDLYLASTLVPHISKFQKVAISAVRVAVLQRNRREGIKEPKVPSLERWADITAGACTAKEVSECCKRFQQLLKQQRRRQKQQAQKQQQQQQQSSSFTTSKLLVRRLWYQLQGASVVGQDDVYIYMLAGFLLHLALLDARLSAAPPTLLALSSMSLSLEQFGRPGWPVQLARLSVYDAPDCDETKQALVALQEKLPAPQLRMLWTNSYSYSSNESTQQVAWTLLYSTLINPGPLIPLAEAIAAHAVAGDAVPQQQQQQQQQQEEEEEVEAVEQQQQQEQDGMVIVMPAGAEAQQQQQRGPLTIEQQPADLQDTAESGAERQPQPTAGTAASPHDSQHAAAAAADMGPSRSRSSTPDVGTPPPAATPTTKSSTAAADAAAAWRGTDGIHTSTPSAAAVVLTRGSGGNGGGGASSSRAAASGDFNLGQQGRLLGADLGAAHDGPLATREPFFSMQPAHKAVQ